MCKLSFNDELNVCGMKLIKFQIGQLEVVKGFLIWDIKIEVLDNVMLCNVV